MNKGYVIVEYYKTGKAKRVVSPSYNYQSVIRDKKKSDYAVVGLSGYGVMYYTKSRAKDECSQLNKLWGYEAFKVHKAEITIIN